MAIRKITPVSRLSSNITSPTPRKVPWARFAMVRPPVPVASSRSSVWTAAPGSGVSGAISVGGLEEVELVDGEQQQPGGEHERGGERRHVPGGEQVDQRHHHDRGDGGAEDDVDGQQDVEFEEEGQGDPDQDAVEPEQAGPDQRPVGAQEIGGQGAGGQAEQARPAELERVDEDADEEQQAGEGVVLEHDLADTAQEGVHHPDCRVALGHRGPAFCRAPWRARDLPWCSALLPSPSSEVDQHQGGRTPGVVFRASGAPPAARR